MAMITSTKEAHGTLKTDSTAKGTMSTDEMTGKISSIQALSISQISVKVVEKIINNLGPTRKAIISNQIAEKQQHEKRSTAPSKQVPLSGSLKSPNRPFLSNDQALQLKTAASSWIRNKITQSFSIPMGFIEEGLSFQISKKSEEPQSEMAVADFIANPAQKNGIKLSDANVPSQFCIRLELDQKSTQSKNILVFALIMQSEGIAFSTETFTLEELSADDSESSTD